MLEKRAHTSIQHHLINQSQVPVCLSVSASVSLSKDLAADDDCMDNSSQHWRTHSKRRPQQQAISISFKSSVGVRVPTISRTHRWSPLDRKTSSEWGWRLRSRFWTSWKWAGIPRDTRQSTAGTDGHWQQRTRCKAHLAGAVSTVTEHFRSSIRWSGTGTKFNTQRHVAVTVSLAAVVWEVLSSSLACRLRLFSPTTRV